MRLINVTSDRTCNGNSDCLCKFSTMDWMDLPLLYANVHSTIGCKLKGHFNETFNN